VRNVAAPLPAASPVETLGVVARRIQHEQRFACAAGAPFRRSEQRRADASPPGLTMHEHLGEVATMRLIFGLRQDHLCGANDPPRGVLRGEHEALAARHAGADMTPERFRFRACHRKHEADGRAAFHAVDQHLTQSLDLALPDSLQASNLDGVGHGHLLAARDRSLAMITTYRAGLRVRLRNAVGSLGSIARQSSLPRRWGTLPSVTSTLPSWTQIC